MTASQRSGRRGESIVEGLYKYEGWDIIGRQIPVGGHTIDLVVKHAVRGEALLEVKVWEAGGGKDTVKKALSDACDLRLQGISTPYILILSHALTGNYRDQICRSLKAGHVSEVRVIGFLPFDCEDAQ